MPGWSPRIVNVAVELLGVPLGHVLEVGVDLERLGDVPARGRPIAGRSSEVMRRARWRRRSWHATIGNGSDGCRAHISLWHPDDVALRTALGKALYRAPDGLRKVLPRVVRDGVRRRVGPFAPWEAGFTHAPPPPGPGEDTGPARLRRDRRPEGRHHVVVRAHRRRIPTWPAAPTFHKERHFFAPLRHGRRSAPSRCSAYHRWFPRPIRPEDGGVDAGLHLPALGPPAARAGRAPRRACSSSSATPSSVSCRGSPTVSSCPDRISGRSWPSPWGAASTRRTAPLGARLRRGPGARPAVRAVRGGPRSGAGPHLPLPGPRRRRSDRTAIARASSPTRTEKVALDPDARRRLVDLYAPDVAELVGLVPDLDLGLWPNFGPTGGHVLTPRRARPRSGAARSGHARDRPGPAGRSIRAASGRARARRAVGRAARPSWTTSTQGQPERACRHGTAAQPPGPYHLRT